MTDYSISVASLTVGAQGVNTLSSDFTNPACNVIQQTNWTPLTNTKYLGAASNANFTVRSIGAHDTRDIEVITWMRQGYVFLRVDATGKAVYFFHNGETTNGTLEIGIVVGLDQASYPSGTYCKLYENLNLVGTVAGYNRTDTIGDAFTFGVSGFDFYAKFDPGTGPVEFVRFKEYRHMAVGSMALKSNATGGYGFRDITHRTLTTATLASDYVNHEINMADWGLRSVATTGSISAGSSTLVVASSSGLNVGDYVIVEIGTETPGGGLRGTIGVGNVWPALHYATTALLMAATPPNNTFAWAEDTGKVWRRVGTVWQGDTDDVLWNTTRYYAGKAVPRSLHARITAISGANVTLDTAATVAAGAARVFLDNQLLFNDLLQQTRPGLTPIAWPNRTMTLTIPAGTYAVGGNIMALADSGASGLTIRGQGRSSSFLISPFGERAARIEVQGWASTTVRDLTLSGNYGVNKFGLAFYDTLTPTPGSLRTTQYDETRGGQIVTTTEGELNETTMTGGYFQSGGIVLSSCNNSVVRDVTVNDVFTNAISFNTLDNGWGYNCTVNVNSPGQAYTQWQINASTLVTNCGFQDCTFNAIGLHPGWETFSATGTQYIRCTSNNGVFSLNNAGSILVQDLAINVSANSAAPVATPSGGMITCTTNTGGDLAGLITFNNLVINVGGYVNSNNDVPYGLVSGGPFPIPNIVINGGSFTSPPYSPPSALAGPMGLNITAVDATVDGFHCCGAVNPSSSGSGWSNISLAQQTNPTVAMGTVRNSIADTIFAQTQTGNINCSAVRVRYTAFAM